MISITKLYYGGKAWGDALRYGEGTRTSAGQGSETGEEAPPASRRKPVVVWNVTRRCNLNCLHCYTDSHDHAYKDELTTEEGMRLLGDLAAFEVPVVLFSGGEPLMRPDIWTLLNHARILGLRTVLSTNGTLIDERIAERCKEAGVAYIGVSLDGVGEVNDRFRGKKGAFEAAVRGIESAGKVGIKTGLRLTLTRHTVVSLEQIFSLASQLPIQRMCFYHLVYAGRGRFIQNEELSYGETRKALDLIIDKSKQLYAGNKSFEVLTVDNHVDGVYLYLRLLRESIKTGEQARAEHAKHVLDLLKRNGGGLYSSGVGIGAIDFEGFVHPDQFWVHCNLGNVKERSFSKIWQDETDPLLHGLRHRREKIKGRCRVCKWFDACGGSLRVRADLLYSDPWAPEPACYLSDDEIGLDPTKREELINNRELFPVPDFFQSSPGVDIAGNDT